jgi:hypothetical protein
MLVTDRIRTDFSTVKTPPSRSNIISGCVSLGLLALKQGMPFAAAAAIK